jgi:hypothetical protein
LESKKERIIIQNKSILSCFDESEQNSTEFTNYKKPLVITNLNNINSNKKSTNSINSGFNGNIQIPWSHQMPSRDSNYPKSSRYVEPVKITKVKQNYKTYSNSTSVYLINLRL